MNRQTRRSDFGVFDWRRAFWNRRIRRLLVTAAAALTVITIGGTLAGPLFLRRLAEQRLGRWLGRRVTIERLQVNPFALSLTAELLQIYEADGRSSFLSVRRVYVDAQVASVFRRAPVVRELRLESPRVRVERRPASGGAGTVAPTYNFSDLVARLASNVAGRSPGPPPRFSLNNIRVVDGRLTFEDLVLLRRHELTDFALGIPFLSTLPSDVDTFVEPGVSGRVDGTPFAISGQTKPLADTLQTIVELRLNALDLRPYLPYLTLPVNATVSSAQLTVAMDIAFARSRGGVPLLSLRGTVALGKVSLREPGPEARTLLALSDLSLTLADVDPLARRYFIDRISASGLDLNLRLRKNGQLEIAGLSLDAAAPPSRAPEASASRPDDGSRFAIRELRMNSSSVRFRDDTVQPPFEASVDDVVVSIDHLSSAPGAEATLTTGFHLSPGTTISQSGRFTLSPLASRGTVSIEGLDLRRFASYYGREVALEILRGRARLAGRYEVTRERQGVSWHLRQADAELRELVVRWPRGGRELLRVPELVLRGGDADSEARALWFDQLSARDGRLRIARDGQGNVDVAALVGPSSAPPWTIGGKRFDLEGWVVRFEDGAVSPPALVIARPLSLHATSLSTAPGRGGNIDLRTGVNEKGRLAMVGAVTLQPPAADLRVDLRALALAPLQSYLRDTANLSIKSGVVSFHGSLRADRPPERTRSSEQRGLPAPRVRLAGFANVTDFAAIDGGDELLRWASLRVGELRVSTPPLTIDIDDVDLTDFGANLVLSPDGHLNFGDVFRPRQASTATPTLAVGKLDLNNGQVRFTDRSLRPMVSARLTDLAGRVSGLSSSPGSRASLNLHGRLEPSGLIAVAGTLNPLEETLFLDVKGEAKDIDLRPASPYATKYLGYTLERGTLSLSVKYHVAQRRIVAQNHLLLDHFTLGHQVPSREAVNLPVKLAVALLKDRHGVIDVDVPLTGALDDPHVGLSSLFWRAFGSAVTKATGEPFPLIARAFGGEGLSYVVFSAGQARVDSGERSKLEVLARALRERPELSFELRGGTDSERDREGLLRERASGRSGPVRDEDLRALAFRRALAVKETLAKLAPGSAGRLFVVTPLAASARGGSTRVELTLKTD